MKTIITLFILLSTFLSRSQSNLISKIKFETELKTINEYVSLLDLKDSNSLVIEISMFTENSNNHVADVIVFQNDGTVMKFNTFGKLVKKKIKQRKIKEVQRVKCWNWLNNLIKYKNYQFYHSEFKDEGRTIINFRMYQGLNKVSVSGRYPKKLDFETIKTLGQQEQRLFMLIKDELKLFSE